MTGANYRVPYGKSSLEFKLPPTMKGTIVDPWYVKPEMDPIHAIRNALANPIESPALVEMA
jgi:hypothetical protein